MTRSIFGLSILAAAAISSTGCSNGNGGFQTTADLSTDTKQDDPDDVDDDGDESSSGSGVLTFGSTSAGPMTTTSTSGTMTGGVTAGDGPADCAGVQRPPGEYADCTPEPGVVGDTVTLCGNARAVCLVNDSVNIGWSVCALNDCESDCDCPMPGTGTALPVCENTTVGDMAAECRLDCSDGATCPVGMRCNGGPWPTCVWDDHSRLYGDCMNGPDCGEGLQCIYDAVSRTQATMGVCVRTNPGCDSDDDCPGWSEYSSVDIDRECNNVQELEDNVCYVGCGGSMPCPPGMVCFEGVEDMCMWPRK